MATYHDRTTAPSVQRGLLRTAGHPCAVLTTDDVLALTAEAPDFLSADVTTHTDAYAAEQAERFAALPQVEDPRSADELLDEIRRTIEVQEAAARPGPPPEPLPSTDVSHDGVRWHMPTIVSTCGNTLTPSIEGFDMDRVVVRNPDAATREDVVTACRGGAICPVVGQNHTPLLLAPAPLLSLSSAFSRRAAIFGVHHA